MAWSTIIGTLLGALIGAAAALVAQQIAAKDAAKRERVQRRAAMREQLENRITSYIGSTQEMERIAAERDRHDNAERNLVHRDLWANHKVLVLICSDELRKLVDDLSNLLTGLLWNGTPDGKPVYEHTRGPDKRFREAARREIQWIED